MYPFQFWIFIGSIGIGIALLLAYRHDWKKALMLALLPFIIYCLINFVVEAIIFGTMLSSANVTKMEYILGNINLSICDIKVVGMLLVLIGWIWVCRSLDRR